MSLLYRIIGSNGVSKISVAAKKEGSKPELIAEICPNLVAILGIWIEAQYYTLPFSSELAKLLSPTRRRKKSYSLLPARRTYIKLFFDDVLHFQSILETFN